VKTSEGSSILSVGFEPTIHIRFTVQEVGILSGSTYTILFMHLLVSEATSFESLSVTSFK